MKKLLSIIGAVNLTLVPVVSTVSCSLFGGSNNDVENEDTKNLNIDQEEEKAIESAVKSVDATVILSKLTGGISANGSLTTNSTINDAISFLEEEAQEIDSSVSVEAIEQDKLNNNLSLGNNNIKVNFKKTVKTKVKL